MAPVKSQRCSPRSTVLKVERIADRREVINHYLACDRRRPHLPDYLTDPVLEDPNKVDQWLKKKHLKPGVISGFRQWVCAQLSFEDLLQCAVVETLSRGVQARRLGDLLDIGFLDGWEPIWPNPVWHEVGALLRRGRDRPCRLSGLPPSKGGGGGVRVHRVRPGPEQRVAGHEPGPRITSIARPADTSGSRTS